MTAVAETRKAPRKKAGKKSTVETLDNGTIVITEITDDAPAPPPKPGEPGYDWAADYPGEDFFVFEASDGQTVALAAPKGDRTLRPGDFRKMTHMEDWQATFFLVEKVASPNALAISDDFTDSDYSEMVKQWTEWHKNSGES